jgi:gliding motility-associated-like protein
MKLKFVGLSPVRSMQLRLLLAFTLLCTSSEGLAQFHRMEGLRLDGFSERKRDLSAELRSLTPAALQAHPDLGLFPYNGPPCSDCIELLERRTAESRYFVRTGSGQSHFFQQQSFGPINYRDGQGYWREINPRLRPVPDQPLRFEANQQPSPLVVDLAGRFANMQDREAVLMFAGDVRLFRRDPDGTLHSLGEPDYSSITAGDDGVRVSEIFPDVDLLILSRQGEAEVDLLLKRPLPVGAGELVFRQQLSAPEGYRIHRPTGEAVDLAVHAPIRVADASGADRFGVEGCFAYDNTPGARALELGSRYASGQLDVTVPVAWLNDPATQYPVVIDPVVNSVNTLGSGLIAGTRYGSVCWTNSCDYNIVVPTPANAQLTNVYYSFEYYAVTNLCQAQDGGYNITTGGCTAPSSAPGVFTCPFPLTNFNCSATNVLITPDVIGCLPPSTCAPQNVSFDLHFFRCNNDPDPTCSPNCIRATQPWIMIIEGRTLEVYNITPTQTVCEGDTATIVVNANYGIGPYTYSWSPAAAANDTIRVAPSTATFYTVMVTDACGTTGSLTTDVQVNAGNNPGFTITPNPVCVNQPVTLLGGGAAAASAYDWVLPGSSAAGGVIQNNRSPIIDYALPGTYSVTLNYQSGTCVFDSTLTVTVDPLDSAEVALSANPSGVICPGTSVRFLATPVNGGSPTYSWLINGLPVPGNATDSLVTASLNNGDIVQVVMNASGGCLSTSTDTATLFVAVSNAVAPDVQINPDTSICPGSSVTFTATPVNGGSTPSYQWTVNGSSVAGATAATFTPTLTAGDTLVGVIMTSSLGCISTPTALDSVRISFLVPQTPAVVLQTTPVGAICAGDTIRFLAQPSTGGSAPLYQWYVNGAVAGGWTTDSTFVLVAPSDNDSVRVTLQSSAFCVTTTSADASFVVDVIAAVSPTVSLQAAPADTVCAGDTVTFTASAFNAGLAGYQWFLNGVSQPVSDSVFTSSGLNDGDVLTVIVQSGLSCALTPSDTDTVRMTVLPVSAPSVSIVPVSSGLCEGEPVQLAAAYANGGSLPGLVWNVNGSFLSNADTVTATFQNGDMVTVTLASNSRCATTPAATATFLISLQPVVTPSVTILAAPGDTLCVGQSASIFASPVNGGGNPAYTWYVNSLPVFSGSDTYTTTSLTQGDIVQCVMISNASCLSQPGDTSNIIRILSFPPLNVALPGTLSACPGAPVVLTATASGGDGGPYGFTWTGSVSDSSSLVYYPSVNGYVTVQVRDQCGSTPARDSVFVTLRPAPVSAFAYEPVEPFSFNNTVQFQDQSLNAASWTWIIADSDTVMMRNPVYTFEQPGAYNVTLVTQSSNGCTDTVTYRIFIREEIAVYFPNSFTPNKDGKNDTWLPIGQSLGTFSFAIYDRWGQIIFEGDEAHPWPGTFKDSDRLIPEGVYVYRVDLKDDKFDPRVVAGRVTLIR